MSLRVTAVLAALLVAAPLGGTDAAALRATALGCKSPSDASKIELLKAKHDVAGLGAFTKAATASGACLSFAKGINVDIDETHAPLSCIRLTGDLSCYWIVAAALDEHPGDKGGGGARKGGGRRH